MSNQEKLEKVAEIMDLEVSDIKEDALLKDYDEWDSVAVLSLIALLDEEFHKSIGGAETKKLVTVQDVMNLME